MDAFTIYCSPRPHCLSSLWCEKVAHFYISKAASFDISIIPPYFPYPMNLPQQPTIAAITTSTCPTSLADNKQQTIMSLNLNSTSETASTIVLSIETSFFPNTRCLTWFQTHSKYLCTSVSYHCKEQVKAWLDQLRRTVDLHHLNNQFQQEIHQIQSPCELAF